MKKIKYFLLFVICFMYVGIVNAENIEINRIVEELKNKDYTANYTDGKLIVSKEGKSTTYDYDEASNILSYTDSESTSATQAISNSDVLKIVVQLSSNYANYDALKSSKSITVDYGEGCDLVNMGVCYNANDKLMQISLTNTFTTFLVNQYGGGSNPDDASKNAEDYTDTEVPIDTEVPVDTTQPTETVQPSQDAKNPTTGSFAEYGVVFGLAALLLVVIILKKRNETEYDL